MVLLGLQLGMYWTYCFSAGCIASPPKVAKLRCTKRAGATLKLGGLTVEIVEGKLIDNGGGGGGGVGVWGGGWRLSGFSLLEK